MSCSSLQIMMSSLSAGEPIYCSILQPTHRPSLAMYGGRSKLRSNANGKQNISPVYMQKFMAKWGEWEGAVGEMHYKAMRCKSAHRCFIDFSLIRNQELAVIPHSQLKDGKWRHVTGTDFFSLRPGISSNCVAAKTKAKCQMTKEIFQDVESWLSCFFFAFVERMKMIDPCPREKITSWRSTPHDECDFQIVFVARASYCSLNCRRIQSLFCLSRTALESLKCVEWIRSKRSIQNEVLEALHSATF